MAIIEGNGNFKSNVEPSLMRIKRRDYTIPVRLNQHFASSSQEKQPEHKAQDQQLVILSRSAAKTDLPREISSLLQLSILSNGNVSKRSKSASKKVHVRNLNLMLIVLVVLTVVQLGVNICKCDTQTSSSSSSSKSGQQQQVSSILSTKNTDNNKQVSASSRLTNRVPYKDHLLSSLADSIEQQHFKTKPSRVFPSRQTRPSKLDLPDSYIELDFPPASSSSGSSKTHQIKNKSIKKADEGLRQILQMHENVNRQPSPPLNTHQPSRPSSSERARFKRWREISRSPVRLSASSLIKPNKVVSQVLSYITPLVGTKLLDPVAILSGENGKSNSTNPFRIIKLNPFVGRSGGSYASFSNEYNIFGPVRSSTQPTTFKPSKSDSLDEPFGSSTLVEGNTNSFSDMKSPINEDSDEIKDLMADSSSLSSFVSNSPLWTGGSANSAATSNVIATSNSDSTPTTSSTTTSSRPPTKNLRPLRGSFWLKNSANQIAQNYFQNSFRDLLTLSQLPILSASSISTAPSILEKKHSSAKKNKNSSKTPLDEFRRRAVEELYRYAYILATGVKNKRDPLLALASYPGLSSLKLINKRGVFNQRSLNQLISANQTEMVNLLHKLRSILPIGPINRAKPRGVMWDMATDPSLAVTVFHLLERASVALPLGFMLMPFVRMIRNPMNGVDFGRLLPPRASHRSVDYEELAKRLDVVDKMLSRALRSTHRESTVGK